MKIAYVNFKDTAFIRTLDEEVTGPEGSWEPKDLPEVYVTELEADTQSESFPYEEFSDGIKEIIVATQITL